MTEFSIDEKRALCGDILTYEGRGIVSGARNRFATVHYDNGTSAEYAWSTIEHLRGWQ